MATDLGKFAPACKKVRICRKAMAHKRLYRRCVQEAAPYVFGPRGAPRTIGLQTTAKKELRIHSMCIAVFLIVAHHMGIVNPSLIKSRLTPW